MIETLRHPIAAFRTDWTESDALGRALLVLVVPAAALIGFVAGIAAAIFWLAYLPI